MVMQENYMTLDEKKILTKTEEIVLLDDNIVYCRVLPGKLMSLEEGKVNIQAISKIANGKRVSVVVDIRESKGVTKECRKYFASKEVAEVQSACALIIESPFSRLIGNFFLGLNKPLFPTKLFNDEHEAINWLKQFG